MANFNTGLIAKSPAVASQSTATMKKTGSRLSKLKVMAGAAFVMLASSLTASATLINSTVSCTQTKTATTSCVNGFYASGWTSNNGFWTYDLNTTGFSAITMNFNTSSSGTGPTKGYIYYNAGAGDILVDSYTVNTSCVNKAFSLPAACENVANLQIKLKMTNASGSGGTNRVPANGVFDGTNTGGCSGTPTAGTVSANQTTICGADSVLFTLNGGASGTGISYQWQSSTDNVNWSPVSGATNLTYKGLVSATRYYRVQTTCAGSGLSANSGAQQVTVNAVPAVSTISGGSSTPLLIGQTTTLSNATAGGTWSSSNTSVATVNASGIVTAVSGGTAVIRYTVQNVAGCENVATSNVNVVWPNTLALYAGYNGTNTNVITIAGETSGALTANNFAVLDTPSAPCASGGLSGLNILPTVTSFNSATGPYVSYILTPDAGKALNMTRITAKTRESDSSARFARIAYRVNGGAWIDENRDVAQSRGGSCGANSNVWDFTLNGANPTVNGITGTLEVAVFPYGTSTKYGTFQLNSLEVYGTITNATACTGIPAVGAVTPSLVNICDTGSRWLNFAGDAGVGLTYQWQKSTDNVTFTDIAGATAATYNTGTLVAGVAPAITYYRVKTTCSGSGLSAFSPADTVNVNSTTSLGAINAPDYIYIGGSAVTLTAPATGGVWSSNDTSVAAINSTTGAVTPNMIGDAVFTYSKTTNGCTARSRDTVNIIHANSIAAYIGKNGRSTQVWTAAGYSATDLANIGFDTTSKCNNGGFSGLKKDGYNTFDAANGPRVSFTLNVGTTPLDITGFYATLRRSNSGISKARLAFNPNSTGWVDGGELDVLADDCGYSAVEFSNPLTPFFLSAFTGSIQFAIYGYAPLANGGTLQINAINITAENALAYMSKQVSADLLKVDGVTIYPNPATNVLNIAANEAVNVSIFSIDGKKVADATNASAIDISRLAAGMYMAQVRSAETNSLIKAVKFTKQ